MLALICPSTLTAATSGTFRIWKLVRRDAESGYTRRKIREKFILKIGLVR